MMEAMKTYRFTLILPDLDDETAERIYARCPDASVGRRNGTPYTAFDREAESLEAAIDSATADLRGLGLQPVRVEMELPTGAD